METFILIIFWIMLIETFFRVCNLMTGAYKQQISVIAYVADTALTIAIFIYAFVILYL